MLITCSACGRQISSEAAACPQCGQPAARKPVTVELTAKKWKIIELAGAVGIILFGLAAFGACAFPTPVPMLICSGLLVLSLGVYLTGRGLAWWYHG